MELRRFTLLLCAALLTGCATVHVTQPVPVSDAERMDRIVRGSVTSADSMSRQAVLLRHEGGRWVESTRLNRRYWQDRYWFTDGQEQWLVECSDGVWRVFDPVPLEAAR